LEAYQLQSTTMAAIVIVIVMCTGAAVLLAAVSGVQKLHPALQSSLHVYD
jgi:hypothetical protein